MGFLTKRDARPRGARDLSDLRKAREGDREARSVRRHPQRNRRLAARMIAMGFRFVTIANDSGLMARAAREQIAITRKGAGDVAN
jgi:2-keto-3-deoxy-L-rhamnonate aldolase RhmA